MRKRPRNIGKEILQGLRQLKRGTVGRVITLPPIAEIRGRTGLSQTDFARLLGVSVRTLQEWEQGRRAPSGPARTLLAIARKNPKALLETAA
jgi:putative transcriptional regulator